MSHDSFPLWLAPSAGDGRMHNLIRLRWLMEANEVWHYYSVVKLTTKTVWYRKINPALSGLVASYSFLSPHLPAGVIDPAFHKDRSVLPITLTLAEEFRRKIRYAGSCLAQAGVFDGDAPHLLCDILALSYHERIAFGID